MIMEGDWQINIRNGKSSKTPINNTTNTSTMGFTICCKTKVISICTSRCMYLYITKAFVKASSSCEPWHMGSLHHSDLGSANLQLPYRHIHTFNFPIKCRSEAVGYTEHPIDRSYLHKKLEWNRFKVLGNWLDTWEGEGDGGFFYGCYQSWS